MVVLVLGSGAFAQGIFDRLDGDFRLLSRATNADGTVFIEIDRTPPNIEEAMREGIHSEAATSYVIITPSYVHYASTNYGTLYDVRNWRDFMVRTEGAVFLISMKTLTFEFAYGQRLNPDHIGQQLEQYFPGGRASPSNYPARTTSPPWNGCVSNTTTTGSTMTCYSEGRRSYRSVCTVNTVTFEISCRSESY